MRGARRLTSASIGSIAEEVAIDDPAWLTPSTGMAVTPGWGEAELVEVRSYPVGPKDSRAHTYRADRARYNRYHARPLSFASIPQCLLLGPHLVVIQDDRYLSETLRGPRSFLRSPAVRQDDEGSWWLQLDAPRRTIDEPVLAIGGRSTDSYFHWMIDVVPRLTAALEHPKLRELPVVMRPIKHDFQHETLGWLGVQPVHVTEELVAVERAVVPSSLVHRKRNARFASDLIELIRSFGDRHVPAATAGASPRLYVSRRDAARRHVSNEGEVRAALDTLGFETVELTGMPLEEQIARFAAAEVIVGQHGGGLTGLLFARPGTHVVELYPRGFPAPSPFWTIASLGDLDYEMLLCDVANPGRPEGETRKNADLHVDVGVLRKVLRQRSTTPR